MNRSLSRWPWCVLIGTFLLSLSTAGSLMAEPNEHQNAAAAIEVYQQALNQSDRTRAKDQFRRAYLLFDKVAQTVPEPSSDLWTNMGNAAAQSDQPGLAIVAYRRALTATPGNRQASINLQVLRNRLPEWVRRDGENNLFETVFFWNRLFRQSTVQVLASACFLIAALTIGLSIYWRQPILRNVAILPLIAWIVLLLSSFGNGDTADSAVVIADEVIGRSANSANSAAKFSTPIPGGTEVAILESRGDWTQIEFSNAQTAWIPSSTLYRFD